MAMVNIEMEDNIRAYLGDRRPGARHSSFDFCFNYFQAHFEEGRLNSLAGDDEIQLSCLHLGFYLASWGMLRGSAELLRRSAKTYAPVVAAVVAAPDSVWRIDANAYTEANIGTILSVAEALRESLHDRASDILVTKVMLGVFGCVPAFDTNFKKGFGVSTFGRGALRRIGEFYNANQELIDRNRVPTIDFLTERSTERTYTRAKVIDMIFFIEGA